jgi:transposase
LIEEYERQIKDIDKIIEEKLKEHKGYQKIKSSIKGIGKTTAAYIVSKIERIERFETHKKLVSYFGLAPKVSESDGKFSNGKISKNTDKGLLRCLIQAAWISVKYDEQMRNFYQNLKKRKCVQKTIIAVARKLVINCFYTLKQAEA